MGKAYLARCGKGAKGSGWSSFDDHGVHFAVGRGAEELDSFVKLFSAEAGPPRP
jgi:hypothetical protein